MTGSAGAYEQSVAGAPVPPSWPDGTRLVSGWPLQDYLKLGALPGAVPCARYHCRQVLWEWRLTRLSGNVELLVSELVTNAVTASQAVDDYLPIRLWLLSDTARVVIMVWDANPRMPVLGRVGVAAESGRGLLLVETISDQWGMFPTPPSGKSVWALTANP